MPERARGAGGGQLGVVTKEQRGGLSLKLNGARGLAVSRQSHSRGKATEGGGRPTSAWQPSGRRRAHMPGAVDGFGNPKADTT